MLERAIPDIILVRKEKSLLFRTNFICQESRDRRGLWSLQGWVGFGAGKLRIEKDGFPPQILTVRLQRFYRCK